MVGVVLISVVLMGSLLFLCIVPSIAGVQAMPTVNIALTEQSKVAHVGPGDNGTVTFTGVVSVTMNQLTRVVVSLTSEDTWDSSVVSPSSIMFTSNGDKPFGVSVTAPPGTSFSNTGTVTVLGRWSMYPGGLSGPANPQQGAVGRIDIAQYFKFSIDSEQSYQEAKPGADLRFDLNVNNEGNWMDTFSIELTNDNDLLKIGINCKLIQSNIELLEKANETICINIETPAGKDKFGTYRINVKVQSDNGLSQGVPPQSFDFTLKLTNNPKYDPTVYSPDPDSDAEANLDTSQKVEESLSGLLTKFYFRLFLLIVIFVILGLILLAWQIKGNKHRRTRRNRYYN
jgi:hypothetical protein